VLQLLLLLLLLLLLNYLVLAYLLREPLSHLEYIPVMSLADITRHHHLSVIYQSIFIVLIYLLVFL